MTRRVSQIDRRALFSSAVAAALLSASGVSADQTPRSGGRLRLAVSGASRSDGWFSGDGLFMQIARQGLVFDTLTEVAANGTLRGELATGWRSFDGARIWQFDLREDAIFHDGVPFTSADVVASAAGFTDGVVRADGPDRVVFDLHDPNPDLPMLLAQPEFYISPAHAMGAGIGTGLYRVQAFTPGQRLLTERVKEHYKNGVAGWFDEVELTSIPAEVVRGQALGEYLVDAADVVASETIAGLSDVSGQPSPRRPLHAISNSIRQPRHVGYQRPLDNLRAAERWWFA